MFSQCLEQVQQKKPLLHCITNYVTVNDCANIVLACGASPIMADDIHEVEDITAICNGLVINIGTLNERTVASMIKAGKKANALGHPVILDPVGAGASAFRTQTVFQLIARSKLYSNSCNISEIKTVALGSGTTKGVDADVADEVNVQTLPEVVQFARALAERTRCCDYHNRKAGFDYNQGQKLFDFQWNRENVPHYRKRLYVDLFIRGLSGSQSRRCFFSLHCSCSCHGTCRRNCRSSCVWDTFVPRSYGRCYQLNDSCSTGWRC